MLITGLFAGLCALMLLYLSIRVIRVRIKDQVSVGAGGVPELERAMRVQANFVEYAPICLLMLGIVEMNGLVDWAVYALGGAFLLGRILHFIGFSSETGPIKLRQIGMLITFAILLVLPGVLIAQYAGFLPQG